MTDTAVSYSSRANARRAAEKLLADGTAPAVDYGIEERDDGRFDIVWKTGTPATTGEIETEITTATSAGEPSAAASEPAPPDAPAATEASQPGAAPQAAAEAEAAPQPAPGCGSSRTGYFAQVGHKSPRHTIR